MRRIAALSIDFSGREEGIKLTTASKARWEGDFESLGGLLRRGDDRLEMNDETDLSRTGVCAGGGVERPGLEPNDSRTLNSLPGSDSANWAMEICCADSRQD